MAALNPKAQLIVMPRTGHLPNLEQPEAFNDTLFGFVEAFT
jgi:pimeloyl-ACP methyl ester carboxylesterase